MKTLQNVLILNHLNTHQIPISSLWTLDQATGYVDLSLTEKFNILEAVMIVTLNEDTEFEDALKQDQKIEFFFNLQDQLYDTNPTLARKVLVNVLDLTSQLTQAAKDFLSLILFNNIWTPKEIQIFTKKALTTSQEVVEQILQKACTYRVNCILTLSSLNYTDPAKYMKHIILNEMDKDIDAILSEMREKNYPEETLSILEDILKYVEESLAKDKDLYINKRMIEDGRKMIQSLDLSNPDSDTLKRVLFVLCLAVKKCTAFLTEKGEKVQGYFPRLTQLTSLMLLMLPQFQSKGGCLLEIGTGEGKSCILAMFAIVQALQGTAVDIVTSSPLLAIRDQEEWGKLYDMFGVTSSTVPPQFEGKRSSDNHEELLKCAYSMRVVYGTVSTFAADILRQEFEKTTTRGQRKCECVIVDEVDYMTLDSGVQVTFLSHQASGLRHLEQVLAALWAMVSNCRQIEIFETGEIWWTTRIQHFHKAVKQSVTGSMSEDDILLQVAKQRSCSQDELVQLERAIRRPQTEDESSEDESCNIIESIMVKTGPEEQFRLLEEFVAETGYNVVVDCYSLIDNKAKLLKESSDTNSDVSMLLLPHGRSCEIMSENSLIETTLGNIKSKIKYSDECSLNSLEKSEGFIVIPSVLKEYVENQLPVFAENALRAIKMTLGREYMIDKASEADNVQSPHHDAIIPLDFQASGVLEKNKRWGDGLQQFLEMKHQLAISQLSNVTNFMSNVHFFKRYLKEKGIYGVSGTLGGTAEKEFLNRQYKTESHIIPAHRHKKLLELPAVQVSGGNTMWVLAIYESAWRAAGRGQVVLIICEDVKTANELQTEMHDKGIKPEQITMYTISEKHNIEKKNFSPGNIIIATNLGGRGTDIHVQQEVNECGGLFVLLTYFPASQRVEKQIFGRTARKGNPGMVQIILNQDFLEPAYRGQSVETMRLIREEHEVKRLESMERHELLEIEIKEDLFSRFCEFLCDFDKNYSAEERSDFTQKSLKDVPACFKIYKKKCDYKVALSALKESWALWLILHEDDISRLDYNNTLREDLTRDLQNTAKHLLQGTSSNFYDYMKIAKGRTILHRLNKKKSDCGALSYWQSAAERDPIYSAVAFYNQAYITINLQKSNYLSEAKQFLKKASTGVDVYLSETANTMAFCNLSVAKDFVSHHKDCNLQSQMNARMNAFRTWKSHMENALKILEQLERSKGQAIVEESSVYSLTKNKDFISTQELMVLDEFGLCIVFDVKKKPEFSFDAFVCFCLGVLQVAAGVLVLTLSQGAASQFGFGLISEGVSDMIHGIKGMIQGSFDWAEWAVSKAISIGVSLVFGGLGRLKNAAGAMRSGAKGLVSGAKHASGFTVKQCFKQATKYTAQELVKQGSINVLSYVADAALTALFKKILKKAFMNKTISLVRANVHLNNALTSFVCSAVPKTAMDHELSDFTIERECEEQIRQSVDVLTRSIIPDLMMDCTRITKVLNTLSEVCGSVRHHMGNQKKVKNVMVILNTAQYITMFVEMLSSFPTEDVINTKFVPQFLHSMKDLPQNDYDQDEWDHLSDVRRLKDELISLIALSVSDALVEACSRHMTSLVTKSCMTAVNRVAGSAVSNLFGRTDTHSFFDSQQHKYQLNKTIQHPSTLQTDKKTCDHYAEEVGNVNRPATALDIHVLTESDDLQGKGIRVIVVDKHGKKLSEDYYPGKNSSAGDIKLRLKKMPENQHQNGEFASKVKKKICGEQSLYSGHFEVLGPHGSVIPVHSENQECLYHAVAQAIRPDCKDLRQEGLNLRGKVQATLQQNPSRYTAAVKLQKGYEETSALSSKYAIVGGGRKEQEEAKRQLMNMINTRDVKNLTEEDINLIKTYNLGLVGKFHDIKGVRRTKGSTSNQNSSSPVNADHIPPINTFQTAHRELMKPENRELKEKLQKYHPRLYEMIDVKGNQGLCREVLTQDHLQVLTTGNSKEAQRVRKKLADVLLQGNEVKLLKMSLIVSNPEMSENLRRDADIRTSKRRQNVLSREATRTYHDTGGQLLLQGYQKMGLLGQEEVDRLQQWQKERLYSRNSPEYKELLKALKPKTFDQNL
ncbi:Protein translocase subunit SecA [Oryzias melastigma]|uniref:Protein translocase subunit SecA n=1 Tax=Oryzias melastigma TaxID=30732 RepID=A0A834FXI0_ORYME|nr:Protein translocase subunit SecA [Oryzias melastigma]